METLLRAQKTRFNYRVFVVKKVINNNTIKMSKAFSTELRTEKVTSIVTYKTYKFFGFPYRVKIVSNDFKTEPIK